MSSLTDKIRAKFPGAYDDLDDATLERQILAKYPEYRDLATPEDPSAGPRQGIRDALTGAAKGLGKTAIGLGEMVAPALRQIPGVRNLVATPEQFGQVREMMEPTNTAQKVGQFVEQGLEYAVPGGAARKAVGKVAAKVVPKLGKVVPAMGAEAAAAAGVASVHGEDVGTAAGLAAAVPVVGKIGNKAAPVLKKAGRRMIRAALKPTVTEMKQTAGASHVGIEKMADRLADFVARNRLTNPDKAQAMIDTAEGQIQGMVGQQATSEPARAARYLSKLKRSAGTQRLPADDVGIIETAQKELLDGSLGENVATTVFKPGNAAPGRGTPGLHGPAMIPVQTTKRALRASTPADEALKAARSSSRWSTNKKWGEQKGTTTEVKKAVERAGRDAVKAAVPESKPVFNRYSQAIKARDVLRRELFREGNRDPISLPAAMVGGAELAQGKLPVMAGIVNWARANYLKLGVHADELADAISKNDVKAAGAILARFGVSLTPEADSSEMEEELLSRVP